MGTLEHILVLDKIPGGGDFLHGHLIEAAIYSLSILLYTKKADSFGKLGEMEVLMKKKWVIILFHLFKG